MLTASKSQFGKCRDKDLNSDLLIHKARSGFLNEFQVLHFVDSSDHSEVGMYSKQTNSNKDNKMEGHRMASI